MSQLLLVEDNPADASILQELILEENGKIIIHWVKDGQEALEFITCGKPEIVGLQSCIILDLGLPKVSGYEVLEGLRNHNCNIPVIVLTTSRNPMDVTRCNDLGAYGYFTKPHDLKGYLDLADNLVNVQMAGLRAAG